MIAGNPPQLERIKLALCKLVQDIKRDRPMRKKRAIAVIDTTKSDRSLIQNIEKRSQSNSTHQKMIAVIDTTKSDRNLVQNSKKRLQFSSTKSAV